MKLPYFIHKLQDDLGVEHLTPDDDGAYVVEFDGHVEVRISELARDSILLQSVIGTEPSDPIAAEGFLQEILRTAVIHYRKSRDVISMRSDSGDVLVHRILGPGTAGESNWRSELEDFVDNVEFWISRVSETEVRSSLPAAMVMLMP